MSKPKRVSVARRTAAKKHVVGGVFRPPDDWTAPVPAPKHGRPLQIREVSFAEMEASWHCEDGCRITPARPNWHAANCPWWKEYANRNKTPF